MALTRTRIRISCMIKKPQHKWSEAFIPFAIRITKYLYPCLCNKILLLDKYNADADLWRLFVNYKDCSAPRFSKTSKPFQSWLGSHISERLRIDKRCLTINKQMEDSPTSATARSCALCCSYEDTRHAIKFWEEIGFGIVQALNCVNFRC